ncbi:HNH endonuclease family protein [Pseudomonas sp. CBC3]|uniref:HNH endonuclease family protein n=1 Tax=Pseudomonas sp. CBC3 TaxID=3123318 RepID=UPI0030E8EEFC
MLEETVDLISKRKNAEQIVRSITEITEAYSKSTEFHESIRSIGNNSRYAYYGWGLIRYFLYEYEQELRKKSKTTRELLIWAKDQNKDSYEKDHKTIEHIFPQRAHDNYWKDRFKNYNVKQRNALRNSLGNLLPVSHGKNSSLSNKGFDIKKGSEINQVGYRYGCLSEIQVSMSEEWNAIEILRRGIYLLEFLERRWKLVIGDTKQKISTLGLGFVLEVEDISEEQVKTSTKAIPAKLIRAAGENKGRTPF